MSQDKKKKEPDIFIVGLQKTKVKNNVAYYAVVTGTTSMPVVDTAEQPLAYASEALKVAVLKLLQDVP